MVDNVKIGVIVSDNGSTKEPIKNVEKLHSVLVDTAAAADKTSKALQSAKLATGGAGGKESVAYSRSRGTIGTGAEARDFAKQSEGLGGLVRLYATYAANIYAAGAAYRALSEAANTANIIQGLNQLGAVSGTALGSLSKQFALASGGAISLRESMQATAQATSAGLTSKQFLQLGDVAKKASQALGVNMSDAVSRLTRGISKLEPELLDELGIFTKLGKSTEDYAKSVGKTVGSLTDFEKRQAFANAVLAEGADKFSNINIPTNPYDKLAASLSNLTFKTLEVVNKGLGPLINALSESPTALFAAVAGISVLMLKQALPALGQYRAGLAEASVTSAALAAQRSKDATTALTAARDMSAKEIQVEKDKIADIKTAEVDAAQDRLKAISKRGIAKSAKTIIQKPDILDITDQDLAVLNKLGEGNTKVARTYRDLARAIEAARTANLDYIASEKALEAKRLAAPGMASAADIAIRQAEAARKAAARSSIISTASTQTSVDGLSVAFSNLFKSIKTEKLGAVQAGFTAVAGTAAIVTTKFVGLISAFSNVLGIVGLLVTAYQLFSSVASKNAEDVAKYTESLKTVKDNTDNVIAVQKNWNNTLTVDSVLAKSTSFTTLADSINSTADAFQKAQANANWFDNLTNSISKIWGGDLQSKFSETVGSAIVNSLKSISDPEIQKEAQEAFKKLLNVKEITEEAIKAGGKEIDPAAAKSLIEKFSKLDQASVAPLQGLNDGFKEVNKSFLELSNSLINNDPLTKFGLSLVKQAGVLSTAFSSPTNAAATLNSILKDTSKIQAFPPETQNSILEAARNYQAISLNIKEYTGRIEEAKKLIAASAALGAPGAAPEAVKQASYLKVQGESALAAATAALQKANAQQVTITTSLDAGLKIAVEKGIKYIEAPLTRAVIQSGIDTQKTLLNFLPRTPESIMLGAKLEVQSIELKKQEITSQRELVNAIKLDILSREKQALIDKQGLIPKADRNNFLRLGREIQAIEAQETAIRTPGAVKGAKSEAVAGLIAENAGYQAQLLVLSTQQQNALVTGVINSVSATFAVAVKNADDTLKSLQEANKKYFEGEEFRGLKAPEQAAEKATRAAAEAEQAAVGTRLKAAEPQAVAGAIRARVAAGSEIAVLAEKATTEAQKQVASTEKILQDQKATAAVVSSRLVSEASATDSVQEQLRISERIGALANTKAQQDQDALNFDAQKLDYQKSIGTITEDQYQEQKRINDLKSADVEYTNKILQLTLAYNKQQAELGRLLLNPPSGSTTEDLVAQAQTNSAIFIQETQQAKQSIDLRRQSITLMSGMDERTKTYAEAFKSTVSSMSDALVDFALTGKQSFGDMIKSMIIDLIKFEQRRTMTAAFSGLGGFAGIAGSIVGSLFGPSTATAAELSSSANMGFYQQAVQPSPNALGGVYDQGRTAFAKGGAFTNTIVTKPTTFAFAKGTGLMGESGPEAIMPLKRGANGSLGVQGGGSNVDVVVNNYGSEKATTKESTDSRGNRRIEVIIGDMTAAEMSRPNSPVQSSMRNTFGIAPSLTRR